MFEQLGLPPSTPYWVVIAVGLVIMFRQELGKFLPSGLQEHFRTRAQAEADRREHTQEIEEVGVEAALQHAVTAQLQLIRLNETLVDFVTGQLMGGIKDLQASMVGVRRCVEQSGGKESIVQIEMSRVADTLAREEVTLKQIETLLMTLVSQQEFMKDEEL